MPGQRLGLSGSPVRAERFRAALQTRVLGRAGPGERDNLRAVHLERGSVTLRSADGVAQVLPGPAMGWFPWQDDLRLELGAGARGTHLLVGAGALGRVLHRRARRQSCALPPIGPPCCGWRGIAAPGRPLAQLIRDRLALEARIYLESSSLTPDQIAAALGFASAAQFNRFFRQVEARSRAVTAPNRPAPPRPVRRGCLHPMTGP